MYVEKSMLNPPDRTVRFLGRCVIPAFLSRFFRARRGAVMIYVAALLPVLAGVALLTVDGARLFNLQTLLQNGVDAFALAGASGRPSGAIPTITVQVTGATFDFMLLNGVLGFDPIPVPGLLATVTGEDLSRAGS